MNTIQFQIARVTKDGLGYVEAGIMIDGISLIQRLKEYELPFAKKKGSPEIAGQYEL